MNYEIERSILTKVVDGHRFNYTTSRIKLSTQLPGHGGTMKIVVDNNEDTPTCTLILPRGQTYTMPLHTFLDMTNIVKGVLSAEGIVEEEQKT